jgi:long-chain acyl-CoA synthetase
MDKPWLEHYDPGVPASIDYPSVPLHHFMEESARRNPSRTATVFFDSELSYGELDALANQIAHALLAMGVSKGDQVALLLPNTPQFVASFYGVLKAGAIVVACNPLYTAKELAYQISDAGATTIITLSKMYPTVQQVVPQTQLQNVIVTNIKEYMPLLLRTAFKFLREKKDGHRVTLASDHHWFQDWISDKPTTAPDVDVGPDDVALYQYTGGTTGVSKGAIATHRALVADSLQINAWLPSMEYGAETYLGVIPFFHVYGMVACMSSAIQQAGRVILLPQFNVDDVLKAIEKYKPTLFPGVPPMYVAINTHPEIGKYDLRSIQACISGAAPLPVEVKKKFEELTGGKLCEGYGLSEAPTATHCNPINGVNKPGSIGLPFPDVECKIEDLQTGEALPPREKGELCIRGPQLMDGYLNQPDETAEALRDGWLHTGDVAHMDEEGYFFIVDRKKDVIISGGYNVYPRNVEEVLYQHPAVKEVAVAGVPHRYYGEMVKAYVVLADNATATEDELIQFCREQLAPYKVPKEIEFRSELPKTLVGKVLRRVLVEGEEQTLKQRQSNLWPA